MGSQSLTGISKFLSYILRHHPEEIDLELDARGWAPVATLLKKARSHNREITLEDIEKVMAASEKNRFILSEDGEYIRASYGHSIPIEMSKDPQKPPEILYHGTAQRNEKNILDKGLHPAGRNFVHLSLEKEDAINVGSRHGKPILFSVNAGKMHQAGYKFYQSESEPGIWLVKEVPPSFIQRT